MIEKMRNIRFLQGGIEEIETYEALNQEILSCNDIDCIPDLCEIMEDDAGNCSAVEGVLETIIRLIKGNDRERALDKVVQGTILMKGHGDAWARILHTQLLRDDELYIPYIKAVKNANEEEKQYIIELLNVINKKKRVKNVDIETIIQMINEGEGNGSKK